MEKKDKNVIYIHRGRNYRSKEIGRLFTEVDFNFDYRGKNSLLLLLKAMITSTEIPKTDIYLVEGGLCLNVAYFLKLSKARKSKLILMVPEPFFNLEGVPKLKRYYIKNMLKKVDGIIAISEMVKEDARKYYRGPIRIANYYIEDIQGFLELKPNIHSRNLLFICERPTETGHIKGLDIVLNIFKIIKKEFSDAKLRIIGSGTNKLVLNQEGIEGLGFADLKKVFSDSSIILAPARYDAFPLAIAEASCAGIIPVISEKVGSKEYVSKADPSLIISGLKASDYAEKISELWKLNQKERDLISEKLRNQAKNLTKEKCFKTYRDVFKEMTD